MNVTLLKQSIDVRKQFSSCREYLRISLDNCSLVTSFFFVRLGPTSIKAHITTPSPQPKPYNHFQGPRTPILSSSLTLPYPYTPKPSPLQIQTTPQTQKKENLPIPIPRLYLKSYIPPLPN